MGINLRELTNPEPIELSDLKGKKLAIDAFNILHQFLSAIRAPDGALFTDKQGRTTSHLMGLFYRTINLLEQGIKPCYVFDGKPVELKGKTMLARQAVREEAKKRYAEALKAEKLDEARKYAQQMGKLTFEMIDDSKRLLDAMGLPWVQAEHDGEAQAAWMAKKGEVYGVVSQDYDCLLFGAPVLIRNLTVSKGQPERIILNDVLKSLGVDQVGLVKLAVLTGTDFNPGVKGIGPKTALKIVKEGRFDEYEIENRDKVLDIFLKPELVEYDLSWKPVDGAAVKEMLASFGFSEKRVENALKRVCGQQKGLGAFF